MNKTELRSILAFSSRFSLLGIAALIAGLCATPVPSSLAADDSEIILYEGSIDRSLLRWHRNLAGEFTPELPDTRSLLETGKPVLPVLGIQILVPVDLGVESLEVVPVSTTLLSLPGPLRFAEPLTSSEGRTVVQDRLPVIETAFPGLWGEYSGNHTWRGYRLVSVRVYPLRAFRDASGEWTGLELLERYTIRISPTTAADISEVVHRQRLVPGERQKNEALLQNFIANPAALATYDRPEGIPIPEPTGHYQPTRTPSLSGSRVTYLIVTTELFADEFQVLADHQTAQGLPAVVATIEWINANFRHGADIQETLRMFIREAYQKWGIEYVLLGGDTDIIPCRYVTSYYHTPQEPTDIPIDIYYSCLDGNWNADGDNLFCEPYQHDLLPGDYADLADDVLLGRAPVSSEAAVTVFVDKVITYNEAAAGSGWTNRGLFAAEVLFPNPWSPGTPITLDGALFTEDIIHGYLEPCTDMEYTKMYGNYEAYPGSVPLNRAAFIDSVNNARYGIVNQMGHGFYFNMSLGDDNFTNADADALTNGNHTFLMFAVNCASAAFDVSCLMERLMQNPNGGSVASIGSSRAAFAFNAHEYQEQFFDHLFCQSEARLGELMATSRLFFLDSVFFNTSDRWTYLNFTMLGDPALSIWTATPAPVQITAPSSLPMGAQDVNITVQSSGSPVAGALVCLNKEGDDYIYGTTDAAGQVVLPFTPQSAGNVDLTVTSKNLAWTQQPIPIAASSSFITVSNVVVYDDGTDGSAGNGNGVIEAGETIAVYVECQDTGGGGALGCTATLPSSSPGLDILDGTALVGDVPPAGVKLSDEPFLLAVQSTVTDGSLLDMQIITTDSGSGVYESHWTLQVLAPEIEPVSLTWSDMVFGNGNGVIEDNERVTVTVTLKNYGAGSADLVTATLRTLNPHITLHDTVVTYTNVLLLDESDGDGSFSFADAKVAWDSWCWILIEDSYGHRVRHEFLLRPPSAPTRLQTDSSLGADTIALSWRQTQPAGVRGYNIYRSQSLAGAFSKVNVDLVDRVSYYRDDGLDLLTRYYYQVATVDSSLVESPLSGIVSESTSPPEMENFPLPFALETSGHCAVGDVDGDDRLEIVLGADEIYVWNEDGSELFDGDNNPQTHGPITNLASQFEPAGIVLAELDGQPGLEIVAAERIGANRIHIFRADGNELSGWPQDLRSAPGNGWPWSTPVVGDVDGDGNPEIVVNTQDGRTWVWHTNGTELADGDNDPSTNGVFIQRPGWDWEFGLCTPALFDLDGDNAKEIIFGTKYSNVENYLYAYRYDGNQATGFPYQTGNNGRVHSSPAVADLNDDGTWEIIFQTKNDFLHVVQQNGLPYAGFPIPFDNIDNRFDPSPAVGDFDTDGELEIAAVSTQSLTAAYIFVIDTDIDGGTSGQTLPGWPQLIPGHSEASPVVGDIDGDGSLDILHGIGGLDTETPNNLFAFSAAGELVDGFPITLGGPLRASPYLTDLDQDGDVDIVYGSGDRLIHVWDMPFDYDAALMPWPTFHGNLLRDGVYQPAGGKNDTEPVVSAELMVLPPHPNPFNPTTQVKLYVPGHDGRSESLELAIYDLQGRQIRILHRGELAVGWHSLIWDGTNARGETQASGIYFLRARRGEQTAIHKMTLLK